MPKQINALVLALSLVTSCTPAERQKLSVPVLTQIDAIGLALMQTVAWCDAHGIDAASIASAKEAIEKKDLGRGIELIRKVLEKTAESGEPVPPEIVALVNTAEGAIAATVVQDFARAVSTPTPTPAPSSSTPAPLPSSGL